MTDEQIKKALENRFAETFDTGWTKIHHNELSNLIDLINRQQAEIERLNVELVGMRGACESYKMHYDNAKTEIERLNNNISAMATTLSNSARQTKSEAIKDILLTLEAEARSSDKYIEEYDDSKEQKAYNQALWKAYNLVKEMVGEGK